jgi:hypothetical protein
LSRVLLRSCTILNFDSILGRAAFGEIWILIWGATLGRKFDVNIGRAERGMQYNVKFGYQLSICFRTEENHGKPDRVGRSQDLPNLKPKLGRIQSVPRRKHNSSPLQRSTG